MDEKLIELLKEMAATEPHGRIDIPRRHTPELARRRHRATLLADKGYAEWESKSKVRITASGYDFIADWESGGAPDREARPREAKKPRWLDKPGWVSAAAAVVIAGFAALAYFNPRTGEAGGSAGDQAGSSELPEPPEWVCSSASISHDDNFMGRARTEIRPAIWWQDQSDDKRLKGYRVLRAAPHSIFDPPGAGAFAPIGGLIPLDTPKLIDSSCTDSCGYRIVSEDVSGQRSRLSEFVHCDVGPGPFDVDCTRSCNGLPEASEQIARYYDSAD